MPAEEDAVSYRAMRWGLLPAWWKRPLKGMPAAFNARAETVDTLPMFSDAFKKRSIIPASGFFKWTGPKSDRIPHFFSAATGGLLGFAGLLRSLAQSQRRGDRELPLKGRFRLFLWHSYPLARDEGEVVAPVFANISNQFSLKSSKRAVFTQTGR